jgi:hypothetical protein
MHVDAITLYARDGNKLAQTTSVVPATLSQGRLFVPLMAMALLPCSNGNVATPFTPL